MRSIPGTGKGMGLETKNYRKRVRPIPRTERGNNRKRGKLSRLGLDSFGPFRTVLTSLGSRSTFFSIGKRVGSKVIKWLRKRATTKLSVIDEVLDASKVVEETTLMRGKLKGLESYCKTTLVQRCFEEGSGCQHTPRLPNQVNTFKALEKKGDYVKDAVTAAVLEACTKKKKSIAKKKKTPLEIFVAKNPSKTRDCALLVVVKLHCLSVTNQKELKEVRLAGDETQKTQI